MMQCGTVSALLNFLIPETGYEIGLSKVLAGMGVPPVGSRAAWFVVFGAASKTAHAGYFVL